MKKRKYVILGLLASIGLLLVLGIPTKLIPNPWFSRMTPIDNLDYFFWISSSVLMGSYLGVHYYKKNTNRTCNVATSSGGVGSFLAFACPVCNKILVALFGATALMTYLYPYQHLLGFASTALLAGTLYWRVKVK